MRLAEHGGLRLDAADAPAEHGEAVDHRGVAVGADERIGDRRASCRRPSSCVGPDRLRQVFEVHLVADAGAGRHDAEIVEGAPGPIAGTCSARRCARIRARRSCSKAFGVPKSSTITEWSMTRSTGTSGLIFCGSPPSLRHRVAHGGEVDDRGNAGEVLHQHAGRAEARSRLLGLAASVEPAGDGLDVVLGDGAAVLEAQQVLQQHLQREGQLGDAGQAVLLGLGQRIVDVGLAAGLERLAALEAVQRHRRCVLQNRLLRAAVDGRTPQSSTLPHGRLATALV